MNDRFKFRVWDKLSNIMTYNFMMGNFFQKSLEDYEKKDWIGLNYEPEYICFINEAIENLVIMQCTGLKDKNGILIYEGDIVKINENYCDYSAIEDFYINQNFVVEYFQPRAVYLLKPFEYKDNDGSGIYDLSPDFYEFLKWKPCGKLEEYTLQGIEVIGNIYEDTHLIQECE